MERAKAEHLLADLLGQLGAGASATTAGIGPASIHLKRLDHPTHVVVFFEIRDESGCVQNGWAAGADFATARKRAAGELMDALTKLPDLTG